MKYECRKVPGFPAYSTDTLGRVFSHYLLGGSAKVLIRPISALPQRLLEGNPDKDGYLKYQFVRHDTGKIVHVRGHTIVMLTFIGPCPVNCEVCHKNDIQDDNRLENLYYGTHKQNLQDFYAKNPTHGKGENSSCSILTEIQVLEIRELNTLGISRKELSNMFGVSYSSIEAIITRRLWKHI